MVSQTRISKVVAITICGEPDSLFLFDGNARPELPCCLQQGKLVVQIREDDVDRRT